MRVTEFATSRRMMNGTVHVPIIENAAPDSSRRWPLVVFSHGLGCARNIYSRVCYDLASYGFVVAAVEHRCVIRKVRRGCVNPVNARMSSPPKHNLRRWAYRYIDRNLSLQKIINVY